jgi:hypothetical protein
MTTDPMVSSRLHVVDEAWPIDEDEQLRQFEANHHSQDRRSEARHISAARNRVVTVTVAFAVFLLGGVFAWQAFRPGGRPTPTGSESAPTPIDASTSTFDTGLRFLEGAVVADDSVWVAGSNGDSERGQLVRMDPRTGEVIARIDVPVPGWEFGGAGITAARGSVWIAAGPTGTDGTVDAGGGLYRIDPATNSVADSVKIGDQYPADLWVDDTGIWVLANAGADHMTVTRLDPDTYSVLASVRLATSWSQTIAHLGGHVWVFGTTQGDAPAETLFELDPMTLALSDEIQPTGGSGFFMTTSGDRIWFSHQGLRALDASTGEQAAGPLARIDEFPAALTGDGTGGVWVLDPSGSRPGLWHADAVGEVDRIDAESFGAKVIGQASAFDPGTDSLWVVHYDGTVTRIDISPDEPSSSPTEATSGRQVVATGSDPIAGPWKVFIEQRDSGPVIGVIVPRQQTFTSELTPVTDGAFGAWSVTGVSGDVELLVQVVGPAVTRAEVHMDDGTIANGKIVDLPADVVGPGKVFVAGFHSQITAEGTSYEPDGVIVAYGSDGQEIDRRRLSQG